MKILLFLLWLLPALAIGQDIRTIEYDDGRIYVGEISNGLPNGQGTLTFPDGGFYVGGFRDDDLVGQGTLTFSNGMIFEGEFKDDMLWKGTITFSDGSIYVGELKDRELWKGTMTYLDGKIYAGEFKDWLPHGQGTLTQPDGSVYVGEFSNGRPSGRGTMTYLNGAIYAGEFKDWLPHGQGTLTQPDGSVYVGEFSNGRLSGRGTITYIDGDVYDGTFENDQFNGKGSLTMSNGNVYIGDFKNNSFNGQGTYTSADGSLYVGNFKDNLLHGQGTFYSINGEIQNGIWEGGVFKTPNNIAVIAPPTNSENTELLQAASGSGFAVSYEGYLVTNNHVIEGCQNVRVHNLGTVLDATVISRDQINDLAILKADFRPTAIFALADNNPELLQDIYVAGFPFGENISSSVKVTKGIISSLTGLGNNFSNIQIDAAIQPGNSGGPLFDNNGNVIGVAVATLDIEYTLDRFDTIPQNTNFGIKANIVSNLLSSNGVETSRPSAEPIQTTQLGQLATNATYYLSCWMTMAQIEQMPSTKVLFNGLNR